MSLYTNCNKCKNEIRFSTKEPDRVELSRLKGDRIDLRCGKCGNTDFYHLNRVKATESKLAQLMALIILIAGTPLTFYLIWDYLFRFTYIYVIIALIEIITLPMIIYLIIDKQQQTKIRQFNKYKIR